VTSVPLIRKCWWKSIAPKDLVYQYNDFPNGPEQGKVFIPPGHKVILNNVSGTVKPGEFLAIMGASGAGKTTLLNYLSAKDISKDLWIRGTILVNGIDRKKISFNKYCAYV